MGISGDWRDGRWFVPVWLTLSVAVPVALLVLVDHAADGNWQVGWGLLLVGLAAGWLAYARYRLRGRSGIRRH